MSCPDIQDKLKTYKLVYNKKDKCCYRDPTASIMFEIGKRLNDENFKVVTYSKSKFHGVNIDILFDDFELKCVA